MKIKIFETIVGTIVLVIAGFFLNYAYTIGNVKPPSESYSVFAKFKRIDGINVGSDVRIGGVKVGVVRNISLDKTFFLAIVEMNIDKKIKLPSDSSAEINTEGFMGGKFISIVPGGSLDSIKPNGEIINTQSSISLEELLGKFIFSSTGSGSGTAK